MSSLFQITDNIKYIEVYLTNTFSVEKDIVDYPQYLLCGGYVLV